MKTNELASRRIAFEEEKLLQQSERGGVVEGEAEELRQRLRNQVKNNYNINNTTSLLRMYTCTCTLLKIHGLISVNLARNI